MVGKIMKHNLKTRLEIAVACLVLLAACSTLSAYPTVTPVLTTPEWILDWLENPECSPPCWQGITPGITDIARARQIQNKYPNMSVEIENGTPTVRLIGLHLSLYDVLPVSALLSKYGEPAYVRIFKCDPTDNCETHVIFDDIGMIVDLYPENIGEGETPAVEITPSTNIAKIFFTKIGVEGYFDVPFFSGGPSPELIPWQGFKRYPE